MVHWLSWSIGHGSSVIGHGSLVLVHRSWFIGIGPLVMVHWSWFIFYFTLLNILLHTTSFTDIVWKYIIENICTYVACMVRTCVLWCVINTYRSIAIFKHLSRNQIYNSRCWVSDLGQWFNWESFCNNDLRQLLFTITMDIDLVQLLGQCDMPWNLYKPMYIDRQSVLVYSWRFCRFSHL